MPPFEALGLIRDAGVEASSRRADKKALPKMQMRDADRVIMSIEGLKILRVVLPF